MHPKLRVCNLQRNLKSKKGKKKENQELHLSFYTPHKKKAEQVWAVGKVQRGEGAER